MKRINKYPAVILLVALTTLVLFQNCSPGFEVLKNSSLTSGSGAVDGLQISILNAQATQGTEFKFRVALNHAISQAVVVNVKTIADTASSTSDFENFEGSVTVPAGQLGVDVPIRTPAFELLSANKTFSLEAVGTSIGSIAKAKGVGTIIALQRPLFAKSISIGNTHACAITLTDTVKCWGNNTSGQLGNGTTTISSAPVDVTGLAGVKSIVLGAYYSCAVTAQNTVKCWGINTNGQLGNGSLTNSSVPVDVTGLTGIVSLSAGFNHTCALNAQSRVKCWGENFSGQLGNRAVINPVVPVDVVGLANVTAIGLGVAHSCAVINQDAVKCWGFNSNGQLGDGTTLLSPFPVDVVGLTGIRSVTAGVNHTCAVNAQGAAMCWGLGGAANSLVPVGLNAGAGVAIKFLSSSSTTSGNDTSHSCMITGQDTLKCWGPNFYGAVGDGTVSSRPIPFDVPGLTAIKAVATGGFSTCAIGAQNSVKCWGLNTFAQLGNHTSAFSSVALEVKSLSGTTAAAPGFHHNCAIGAGGTVKCWGDNFFGQLGNNSNVSSVSPVDVIGLTGVKAVVAGDNHSCAINANDTVSCWGSNNFGQLGSAGNPLRIPTSVPGVVGIIALTAGSNHTCALALSGAVTCWGRNNAGQLGNNSNVNSTIPVNVVGITGAKALVTGSEHNCVITAQDTVKCWGLDASNQLGNNDGVALNSLVPTDVFGLTGVKSMASGAAHNCVLTAQNNLKCWGANSFGQLGNRTASMPVDSAVDAVGLTGIKGVALGRGHTCAITAQNTVQCWGSGNFGHLGNNSTQHSLIPQDVVGLKDVKSIAAKEYRTIAISTDGLQTKQFGYLQSNSLVPIDVTVPAPPVP